MARSCMAWASTANGKPSRLVRATVVLGLTVIWWSCAVGVTLLLKAVLGGDPGAEHVPWKFPFPLTLTLLSNVATAAATSLLAWMCLPAAPVDAVKEQPALSPDSQNIASGQLVTPSSSPGPCSEPADSGHAESDRSTRAGSRRVSTLRARGRLAGLLTPGLGGVGVSALAVIGLVQGLALGTKNEALLLLSVSTRTMIFATSVLAVMFVARLLGLEAFKKTKIVAALLLAGGGMLQGVASWKAQAQDPSTTPSERLLGFALAICAILLDALRWVLLQQQFKKAWQPPAVQHYKLPLPTPCREDQLGESLLSPGARSLRISMPGGGGAGASAIGDTGRALSKLQMVSSVMWTTTPICFLLAVAFEPAGLPHMLRHPTEASAVILLLTIGVTGINLSEFGVVQWTSAVTFNVLAQLHGIPLVLGGVLYFGEKVSSAQLAGFAMCVLGALVYTLAKVWEGNSRK